MLGFYGVPLNPTYDKKIVHYLVYYDLTNMAIVVIQGNFLNYCKILQLQ
jgi:hypothetical protein